MKKLLLAASILLLSATGASAQVAGNVRQGAPFFPLGYCQLTSIAAATLLSSCPGGIPQRTVTVQICVEAQGIRYRDDGTNPTAAVGMPIASGTCFPYTGNMAALAFIQQTATAIVNVSFYK